MTQYVRFEFNRNSLMSPNDVMALLARLVKNPYLDIYVEMPEYELASWKYVFETSIALGAKNREKVLRLRAINQALKGLGSTRASAAKPARSKNSGAQVSRAA